MRRAVTPAIPPRAYRHFAIITLALTTGLAMFADGESREAQAAHVAEPKPVQTQAPATFAAPAQSSGRVPGGWDDDSDAGGHFGQPMERLWGGDDSTAIPEELIESPSLDEEDSLTKAERELLLRGMRENLRPAPTAG